MTRRGRRWRLMWTGERTAHVRPVKDLRRHVPTPRCWCQPARRQEGLCRIYVHQSMDGRELVERFGLM